MISPLQFGAHLIRFQVQGNPQQPVSELQQRRAAQQVMNHPADRLCLTTSADDVSQTDAYSGNWLLLDAEESDVYRDRRQAGEDSSNLKLAFEQTAIPATLEISFPNPDGDRNLGYPTILTDLNSL